MTADIQFPPVSCFICNSSHDIGIFHTIEDGLKMGYVVCRPCLPHFISAQILCAHFEQAHAAISPQPEQPD